MNFELDFMPKVLASPPSHMFSSQSKVLTEISPHITGNIHFSRKTNPYSVRGDFKSYGSLTKNLCRPFHPPIRFQKPPEAGELDDLAVRVLRHRFYHPAAEPGVRPLTVIVFGEIHSKHTVATPPMTAADERGSRDISRHSVLKVLIKGLTGLDKTVNSCYI